MKSRFFVSLGMKIMLISLVLLSFTLALSALAIVWVGHQALRNDLDAKMVQDSQFLATASEDFMLRTPHSRERLARLVHNLLEKPEILAVTVLDRQSHVLAQSSKRLGSVNDLFSQKVPVYSNRRTVGWIRAWYSPEFAFKEYWVQVRDLGLLLSCVMLLVFAVILFSVSERLLARPFRSLITAIETFNQTSHLPWLPLTRRDEWGLLAQQLRTLLDRLQEAEQRYNILYESSRLLSQPAEMREATERVLSSLVNRYELASCLVYMPQENQALALAYSIGLSLEFTQSFRLPPGHSVVEAVYISSQPRVLQDTRRQEADSLVSELMQRQQIRSALFVPLLMEGRPHGVLALFSRTPDAFWEARVGALSQFAQHLALAIRNGQVISQLKELNYRLETEVSSTAEELTQTNTRLIQKVRELKTVYDLALATAACTHVEEIVGVIISRVKELIDVQGAAFFIWNKETGFLEALPPAFEHPATTAPRLNSPLEKYPFLKQVLEKGQPEIVNLVETPGMLPGSWTLEGEPIRSILTLPLREGASVEGLFCVVNKLNGVFTADDMRLLSLLTNRVTEVLHRLALDQDLRGRVRDLSLLQDIATALPSPPVLADTVESIGRITRRSLPGVSFCLFFLYQPLNELLMLAGGDWEPTVMLNPDDLAVGISEKMPLGEVFRVGQAKCFPSSEAAAAWPRDKLLQAAVSASLLYLPLRVENRTIGVMALGGARADSFTPEIRHLANFMAEHIAVIVERSQLYERLRSANEKLEQMNQLKNEFISMVSHELRTPLTTIKGYVAIVRNEETGPLNSQQRHFLDTADRAIDRLALLVSDLLGISRMEAGQLKMQLRPVALPELLRNVVENFDLRAKAQHLSLQLDLQEPLPMVLADPPRILQVMDNLLSNALKFTPQGGITIHAQDKGDFVLISVKDTGSGIAVNEQERIFDKFYQIKAGSAWPSKGTGLGLAIVKSIIESHHGKVWVESRLDAGADFRFLLPRARTPVAGSSPV